MVIEASSDKLEATYEATRQRIREDAQRAPAGWEPLFEEIEKRIFDTDFKLGKARSAAGLLRAGDQEAFEARFGCSPLIYLRQRRLETARALLNLGELPAWQVARLTGFKSAQALWHASRSQQQLVRLKGQEEPKLALSRRPPRARKPNDPVVSRRQLLGTSSEIAEAQKQDDRLEAQSIFDDLPQREQVWAHLWWTTMRCLPVETQRSLVASAPFETTAFFEHLCEQSREEGRDDRQRGVQVAQLALAALEPLKKHIPEPALSHWQGKGWACLGNAHCQALDYESAERALATAARFLGSGEPPVELSAELLFYRSLLRCGQQHLAEALKLSEKALELLKGRVGRLTSQVFMTRARVYAHLGQTERALPDLHAALEVLDAPSEPFLTWMVHQNLASALWRLGRLEEAEQWLERSRPLAASLGKLGPWCHTVWLEGLLAAGRGRLDGATARMREACEGLRGIGEWAEFAVAALDLARLEERRGEGAEAMRWAAQALPHLEVLRMEREGQAALALLRRELAMKQLSAAVLEQLRRSAGRAVGAPELMEDKKT